MGAHLINALPITYKVHSVQGYQSARDLIPCYVEQHTGPVHFDPDLASADLTRILPLDYIFNGSGQGSNLLIQVSNSGCHSSR